MTPAPRAGFARYGLHLRSFAGWVVLVCLLTGACDTRVPSGSPGPTAVAPLPSTGAPTFAATSTGQATEPSNLTLRAEGMRLLGSVPGSNADVAFWGDLAIVTNVVDWNAESPDDGFVVIDVSDGTSPAIVGRFACAGSFQDVSVWDDLVVVSQDRITAGDACGAEPADEFDATGFAGLRIVSIEDPARPVLLASVPTGVEDSAGARSIRGSHTNTIVPDLANGRLLVYAGMFYYPGVTPDATIVEVPLDDPAAARAVGAFDNGIGSTCHEITVHLPSRLAACSGFEHGLTLFDVADLESPEIISQVVDPQMAIDGAIWHSAVFSNDGRSLVVNAEIFAEDRDGSCPGGSDSTAGALRLYDIADPRDPQLRAVFQLPRHTADHFCYAHKSGIVPMEGERDVLVSGWFGGGVNLLDFTDLANPRELAFWVAAEPDGGHSYTDVAYWYNGRIYAANLAVSETDSPVTQRGFEVFELDGGILEDTLRLPHLNPQTQEGE